MRWFLLSVVCLQLAAAQTSFEVVRKKTWRPNGGGELRITDAGIEYQARKEKYSRRWAYASSMPIGPPPITSK